MAVYTSNIGPDPIIDAAMLSITEIADAGYLCNLATKHGLTILSINPAGIIVGYRKNTESEQRMIALKSELLKKYGLYESTYNRSFIKKAMDIFKLRR